jgi:hypothetical protein
MARFESASAVLVLSKKSCAKHLAKDIGIGKAARMVGLGVGTVAKLKPEMAAAA